MNSQDSQEVCFSYLNMENIEIKSRNVYFLGIIVLGKNRISKNNWTHS